MTPAATVPPLVGADEVTARVDALVDELLDGCGAVRIGGVLPAERVAEARRLIRRAPGGSEGGRHRVWGLLGLGEVFVEMVQLAPVLALVDALLGDLCILGSIGSHRLLPGARGQGAHIDYPYWDLYNPEAYPRRFGAAYSLNCQVTICLDDFDADSGATAWVPGSQRHLSFPGDRASFDAAASRLTGRAGDALVFNGACHHASMPNTGDRERTGVLLQYLPWFVVPMEDLAATVPSSVLADATPTLRRLLGLHERGVDTIDLPPDCPRVPEGRRDGGPRTDAGATYGN
ncbi:MAG: phytanoyl-CoA dioxygenase [Actinomyces sp.]|nr:MAG: phytanoyl-CoA dioxygenase [Actinomyces sp.]